MTDGETGEPTEPGAAGNTGAAGSSLGRRGAWAVLASIVCLPLLTIYVFYLLWFSPEITIVSTCTPGQLGCRSKHGLALWVGTFLASVTGTACLMLTWTGVPGARRWWPRPVAAVTILAGWTVALQLWST